VGFLAEIGTADGEAPAKAVLFLGGLQAQKRTKGDRGMKDSRIWVFRVLTLAGAGMFLYSWFEPWWQAWIVYLKTPALWIRPWGVDMYLPPEYAASISGYEMPAIFAPFMWTYLVVCMAILLYSMFASSAKKITLGKLSMSLPTALVLGVGLSYIFTVVVALIVMQMRMAGFYNAPLIGSIYIGLDEGHKSYVDTSLLTGFYVACATGPVLVVLAVLRQFIVDKDAK
jgi:hypothetical protein